jgi:hypothetical protein
MATRRSFAGLDWKEWNKQKLFWRIQRFKIRIAMRSSQFCIVRRMGRTSKRNFAPLTSISGTTYKAARTRRGIFVVRAAITCAAAAYAVFSIGA